MLAFQITPKKSFGIFCGLAGVSLTWMLRDSISRRHPGKALLLKQSRNFEDVVTPVTPFEVSVARSLCLGDRKLVTLPPGMYISVHGGRRHINQENPATLSIRPDILPDGMSPEAFAAELEGDLCFAAMEPGAVEVTYLPQDLARTNIPTVYAARCVPVSEHQIFADGPLAFFDRHIREAIYLSATADQRMADEIAVPDLEALRFRILRCEPTPWKEELAYDVEFEICAEFAAPLVLGLETIGFDLNSGLVRPVANQHLSAA
jgi:hypothetical protein